MLEEDSEEESERTSDSSSVGDASFTDEEVKVDKAEMPSLRGKMREKLCLKAEPENSNVVTLYPVLVKEWISWTQKGL